jgi:hypothetical protein
MAHYSNLIFLLIQLVLVQSNDPNQKRLTTRNQREVLYTSDQIPVGKRPPMVNSKAFFEQSYFRTQTTSRYAISNFGSNLLIDHAEMQKIVKMANRLSEEGRRNQQEHCDYFPGNVS